MDNNEKFEFIKETHKDRPFNKKKFVTKLIVSVSLAVIFGFIAAICFTIGTHSFEDALYPEKVTPIVIEDINDTVSEGSWDSSVSLNEDEEDNMESETKETTETVINTIVEKVDFSISDYEAVYSNMYNIAQEASKSLVLVSGIDSETDWFDEGFNNSEKGSGLIFADNGKELLILVNNSIIDTSDIVNIEFSDGEIVEGEIKRQDSDIDIAVVAIPLANISASAKSTYKIATFGSTNIPTIEGKAIIAIGRPNGYYSSVEYGYITSNSNVQQMTDMDVRMITTNIDSNLGASGVIINLRGRVLGLINNNFVDSDTIRTANALSISDIKPLIENMSNDRERAILGIKGMDVTQRASEELGVPKGAYVTEIVMDSPAMNAGIQSGDIITSIDGKDINSFETYVSTMNEKHPGDICRIKIKRFAQGEYKEVSFDITLGNL